MEKKVGKIYDKNRTFWVSQKMWFVEYADIWKELLSEKISAYSTVWQNGYLKIGYIKKTKSMKTKFCVHG